MIRAELEKWRVTIANCYSRYMAYKLGSVTQTVYGDN